MRDVQEIERSGGHLPQFVRREFEEYLKCGLLEHGFLRVKCDGCRHEHLVAFSCKRRGFCPSCGARRMVESAAHLVDHVFPEAPIRQFVLTFPFPLRFLLAAVPKALTEVLAVVQRRISTFLIRRTGFTNEAGLGHAGGTSPGMDSVERSRMPEPSATQELLPRGASADPQDSGTCSA